MATYKTNIGAYQTDAPGATYKTNIGADQTDAVVGGEVKELTGVITGQSVITGFAAITWKLIGSVVCQSTVTGNLVGVVLLTGTVTVQSTVAGNLTKAGEAELVCALIGRSTTSGEVQVTKGVTWNAAGLAVTSGVIRATYKLTGTIGVQSVIAANIKVSRKLTGTIACQASAAVAGMKITRKVTGVVVGQSNVLAIVRIAWGFSGTVAASSTVTAELAVSPREVFVTGTVTGRSIVIGKLSLPAFFPEIPPAMEKDLIDLYSGGAWLWLCEVSIPGYSMIRMARNTEGVIYGGNDFPKGNFDVGRQCLVGDGSIPRLLLRIAQDRERTIENIINATHGGVGGHVKIIRTCEKFFDLAVAELELSFDVLSVETDPEWVTFSLGMPNPLIRRIPLRLYSSKACPWATQFLFKGPECQYAGLDDSCTGLLWDCREKENAEHFGARVGLDPNALRV